MIVLVNPASTPSPRKPLPMSLLAVGALLEGEFDYAIVDGNVDPDPVERIASIARAHAADGDRHHRDARAAAAARRAAVARAEARGCRACRSSGAATSRRSMPSGAARSGASTTASAVRASTRFRSLMRVLTRGGALDDIAGLSYRAGRTRQAQRRWRRWRRSTRCRCGRTTGSRCRATSIAIISATASARITRRTAARSPAASARWSGSPIAAGWPSRPIASSAVLRLFKTRYGADAVQFHDMDFFISEPRTAAIAERMRALGLTWWALGRVDELMRYSTATWEAMKQQRPEDGVLRRRVGIDRDAASEMNKGGTAAAEQTLDLARRMKEFGIVPEFSFVVGNPPDPEGDLRQTLEFIRRVKSDQRGGGDHSLRVLAGAGRATADARNGFAFPETLDEWVERTLAVVLRCAAIRGRRGRRRRSDSACATSRPC